MYWVLQNDLYNEESFELLLSALDRLGFPHSVHKVVPFLGTLDPEPVPPNNNVIVLGSYSLARAAKLRGWVPGAYLENLDFTIQRQHWGASMLNADAEIYPFAAIPFQREPFFMRPVHDTKTFTGLVADWGYYTEWRDGVLRLPETADPTNDPLGVSVLTPLTPTMLCKKKEIWNETRCWFVDGALVTCSGYKVGTIKRYTGPEDVDEGIRRFASVCAEQWSPNQAYVMDIAETPEGMKIVEINNLNSAGFYKADMIKLVAAIEHLGPVVS